MCVCPPVSQLGCGMGPPCGAGVASLAEEGGQGYVHRDKGQFLTPGGQGRCWRRAGPQHSQACPGGTQSAAT